MAPAQEAERNRGRVNSIAPSVLRKTPERAKMSHKLKELVASTGVIPLSWVSKTAHQDYLNLGDALSPVIVSFLSSLPVKHAAAKSDEVRLAAVGTIGHMFAGGDVSFWGTGTSPHLNPNAAGQDKIPYFRPRDTKMTVLATRGPFTRNLLAPDASGPAVFGDPLWLLPRFHTAPVEKRYELGVIVHLSELEGRSFTKVVPKADHLRYTISSADAKSIKLINTVTPVSVSGLRDRLDEILSCKRIVSTSLHGMVFAESYGIPCLYFSPRSADAGFGSIDLSTEEGVDLRLNDLYRGLGQSAMDVWFQPRRLETDWEQLINTVDKVWFQKHLDEDALIDAFPLRVMPLPKGSSGSAFDHPLIAGVPTSKPAGVVAAKAWLGRMISRIR